MTVYSIGLELGEALRARPAGVARYGANLAQALCGLHDGRSLLDPELSLTAWYPFKRIPRAYQRVPGVPSRWMRARKPADSPDVFHATGWTFPKWKSPIEILTLHDLYPLRQEVNPSQADIARHTLLARHASMVLCVSEWTRAHLLWLSDSVDPSRVKAVPLGVSENFLLAPQHDAVRVRDQLRLPSEFLLFVGRPRPNKNLQRLVEAYACTGVKVPLLIAGKQSRESAAYIKRIATDCGVAGRVRLLGYIADGNLPGLMAAASAFCFPSTFEGFGLPVLEAMSVGTPVLTSKGTACEEAANGFASLVEPLSVDSIANGIHDALHADAEARNAARVYARSQTWTLVARRTAQVYREALTGHGTARIKTIEHEEGASDGGNICTNVSGRVTRQDHDFGDQSSTDRRASQT